MRRLWMMIGLLAACGGSGSGGGAAGAGGGGGGGTVGAGGDNTPCTLEVDAESARLGWGERRAFVVTASSGWAIGEAPDDWRVRGEVDQLHVAAPYASGSARLVVTADCGASAELALESTPLRWTELPSWEPGETGPVEREYFTWWIDRSNPDRAWLFGGFHYRPRQFTVGNDLWTLDLASGAWTSHDAPEGAPGLAGASIAPVPDRDAVLWYGGLAISATGTPSLPFTLTRFDYGTTTPAFEALTPEGAAARGDSQPAFVWDAPRERYVALCGANFSGMHCALHEYVPRPTRGRRCGRRVRARRVATAWRGCTTRRTNAWCSSAASAAEAATTRAIAIGRRGRSSSRRIHLAGCGSICSSRRRAGGTRCGRAIR